MSDLKVLLVVRGIIENERGEILLVQRKKDRDYNPNKWELPGGKVLNNEDIEDALERILMEETNLIVKNLGGKHYIQRRFVTESGKYKDYNYFEIALTSEYVTGNAKIDNEEHTSCRWVAPQKALDLDLSIESRKAIVKFLDDVVLKRAGDIIETRVVLVSRALIKEGNKYLVLKRSAEERYPNLWEIPGGTLNSFESLNENLIREVLEETGLVIDIDEPNLYLHSFIPKEGKYRGITFINIINGGKIRSGKLKVSFEHSEHKWVTKEEIMEFQMAEYMKLSLTEIFLKRKR